MTRAEILFIKSLRQRSERNATGLFVAEGDKAISELISVGFSYKTIYKTARSILVPGEIVGENEISRLSTMKTAASSVALFKIPSTNEKPQPGLKLALDGVQDPGNLGTIIRIADWFGVGQIFCSRETADCYGSKAIQASMGAIGRVSVIYCDLPATLAKTSETVYGTFLERGKNIYETTLNSACWLVLGSEGRGISSDVEQIVGERIFIPSFRESGNVESLNVGVACGIAVSEFRRGGNDLR